MPLGMQEAGMQDASALRIGFVGAGQINFGAFEGEAPEGPWDHSKRLQELPDVVFTAVVDPDVKLAARRIEVLQGGSCGGKWTGAKAFGSCADMLASPEKPEAVFIGVPPHVHGALNDPSADLELQLAKAGVHMLIEKPLSLRPPEEVEALAAELARLQQQHGLVVAVGYMLRYSPAIQAAKRILEEHGGKPVAVLARYACGYSAIKKTSWWDTAACGGPIVEQATHFLDLMRLFGGAVKYDTVHAEAVSPSLLLSDMPAAPAGEQTVPEERRINRATASVFRFEGGGLGSLTHTVLLHGSAYHTVVELLADGLHLLVENPYGDAQLTVRRPHSAAYEKVDYAGTGDMYARQAAAFVQAVSERDAAMPLSTYADAVESYKLSWEIARSSRT